MKLRRPITNFKSAAQQKTKPAFWNFDSSSNFGSEDARFLELKAYYSRPSGKMTRSLHYSQCFFT